MAARRRFRWSFRDAREISRASAYDAAPKPKGDQPRGRARTANGNAGAESEWPPTAGGVNPEEESFDQRRRRVRLTGRDEEGSNYGAELWLPEGGRGYGGDRKVGDAAIRDLVTPRDGRADISGLAELQRRLNQHYRS